MKLLFIEDNSEFTEFLTTLLGSNYVIDIAESGEEGIHKATSNSYDAILLDLGLPDIHGQSVCSAIRKADIPTPILVLTGDITYDTKVSLFSCGADDYVTKPFNNSEFRARLRALLRRSPDKIKSSHVLKIYDLTLDPINRAVMRGKQRIILRRKEFDILEFLLRNKGKIVTRAMLINYVWGGQNSSWHNTIDVHIKYLRDKIDRPFDSKIIRTVYGMGYTIDQDSHAQYVDRARNNQR